MNIPDLKNVKKLATLCRKAGITSFKCYNDGSYEFSIDPSSVEPTKRTKKQESVIKSDVKSPNFDIENGDSILTEEQLLFWSSGNTNKEPEMPS